jgi:hypothetical protein
MKKLFYILFTFHISLLAVYTQPVSQELVRIHPSPISQYTQFQVTIGTPNTDVAHSIIQTADAGYAVAGYTWAGGFYAYIAKLDASLMLQWTRTFGGTGDDNISSIIQTIDGGYVAAGSSIFKLDANGTLQWCENISGESGSIIQTTDGGYAVAGSTNSFGAGQTDMFILKLNSAGILQWARTVGGTGWDYAYSIIQTTDGGYAVAGSTPFAGGLNIFAIKLNASGALVWAKTVGGPGDDEGYSIIQTIDGGCAVAGITRDLSADLLFYIVKLNSAGALQWTRKVGLRNNNIAHLIMQTTDGGYAVAGYASYIEGFPDWYIVKLDSTGTLEWSKVVGGGIEIGDEAYSIIKTVDGGYAVAGVKDSFEPAGDMYIVKYDSNWNTCNSNDSLVSSSSGTWGTLTTVTPIVTSPNGFITPRTPTMGSGGTATMICVTGIQPVSNKIPVSFKLYQNYPNPFNPVTKIKFDIPAVGVQYTEPLRLVIYDILGREVTVLVNKELKPGTYEVNWNADNNASGIYFYSLQTDGFFESKKMALIK